MKQGPAFREDWSLLMDAEIESVLVLRFAFGFEGGRSRF